MNANALFSATGDRGFPSIPVAMRLFRGSDESVVEIHFGVAHDAEHPDADREVRFLEEFSRELAGVGVKHTVQKRKKRDQEGRPVGERAIDRIRIPLTVDKPALDPC